MDTKTVQISVGYDTITFGEYDSHFEQAIQKEDDLYRIPKNDITVTHVKRSIRTKENTIPVCDTSEFIHLDCFLIDCTS